MLSKGHEHFGAAMEMLKTVHFAHTADMREMLESVVYDVWHVWEQKGEESGSYTTVQLWDEYFLDPWVYVCAFMRIVCAIMRP